MPGAESAATGSRKGIQVDSDDAATVRREVAAFARPQRIHSVTANNIIGWLCSLCTFTPYANRASQHAQRHAGWNNLDSDFAVLTLSDEERNRLVRFRDVALPGKPAAEQRS
jgi:hypothetical protein